MDLLQQQAKLKVLLKEPAVENFNGSCGILGASHIQRDRFLYAFGEFGGRLHDFISLSDKSHPDLHRLYQEFKTEFDDLYDAIQLADLASANSLHVYERLRKALVSKLPDRILKISSPLESGKNVRFLKHSEDIARARQSKSPQRIDMRHFCSRKLSMWDCMPDDFSSYFRFDESYKDDLAKAQEMADRYDQLGCKELASEVRASIQSFNREGDILFGFHRITMTNASVIMAKMMGLKISRIAQRIINKDGDIFRPIACPLHELPITDDILEIYNMMEKFQGHPLFDHYIVLIPSFYSESEQESEKLDMIQLKDKVIMGSPLLGERDGKCFFISYWT